MSAAAKKKAMNFNAFPQVAMDEREITVSTGKKFTGLYAIVVIVAVTLFAIFTAATMGKGVSMKTEPESYRPGEAGSGGVEFDKIVELQKNFEDVKCYASNTSPLRNTFSSVQWDLDGVCTALFDHYDPHEKCDRSTGNTKDNQYFCFEEMAWSGAKYGGSATATSEQKKNFFLGKDFVQTMKVIDMFSLACKKARTVTQGIATGITSKSVSNPTILPENVVKASLDADVAMAQGSFPALFGTSFITPIMWWAFNGPLKKVDANLNVVDEGNSFYTSDKEGDDGSPGYDKYLYFFERPMSEYKADWLSEQTLGAFDAKGEQKKQSWRAFMTKLATSKFDSFGHGLNSMFVAESTVSMTYKTYVEESKVTHCTYIVDNEVSVMGVIAAVLGIFAGLNTFIKAVVGKLVDQRIAKLEKEEGSGKSNAVVQVTEA